jgi:hypothetical protein
MAFERWEGEDRWGLFYWQKRLYVVPVHPFANIMDGHRAEAVQWVPRAVGTEGFIPRDADPVPVAGPYATRGAALAAANGRRVRDRLRLAAAEGHRG